MHMQSRSRKEAAGQAQECATEIPQSKHRLKRRVEAGVLLAATILLPLSAAANGGPFVLKYPGGDPAAKGVLARLDPSLKPAREERLQVTKEELSMTVLPEPMVNAKGVRGNSLPKVRVTARYFISNPTDERIEVDFGFPILRGIYLSPYSMMPTPDAQVTVETGKATTGVPVDIISNSAIYGLIRSRARTEIEAAIERDPRLRDLVRTVRAADGETKAKAREALAGSLRGELGWSERDTTLMLEYASLDLGRPVQGWPFDAAWGGRSRDETLRSLALANLGPLVAIGEQKATQLLAGLAARWTPAAGADYEAIFAAWGGTVREQSIDLTTGQVRPREYQAVNDTPRPGASSALEANPAIYARVDYLDENAKITDAEKASCKAILKHLPVTFTFAPMNLLHYQVAFTPKAEQVVAVSYTQYAYLDTAKPESYQMAYVVHPASLWKDFGPIHLTVRVPERVRATASVPLESTGTVQVTNRFEPLPVRCTEYRGEVRQKTGELFVGVDAESWRQQTGQAKAEQASVK